MTTSEEYSYALLRAVRRIVRQVSLHSREMSDELGLTVPQLLCMRAIDDLGAEDGDLTLAAVADAVQLSRSTVSTIIERLVRAGLVRRERSAVDRRQVDLKLTEAGAARLSAGPSPLQDSFLRRVESLPDAEKDAMLAALCRVAALMDAEALDAAPMLASGEDLSQGEPR